MSATGSFTVLLVDDSALIRRRMSALLRESPRLRVVGEAEGVAESLRLFAERRPDAVVLDLQLLDGSSLPVLRQIKQLAPGCVVIMLTSFSAPEYRRECQQSGADYFFHKATEFESVASVLGELAATGRNRPATDGTAPEHES